MGVDLKILRTGEIGSVATILLSCVIRGTRHEVIKNLLFVGSI